MKLYCFCDKNIFSNEQIKLIKKCIEVKFVNLNDIELISQDKNEKVYVYDPEFISWDFPNELITKVDNIKSICLGTTTKSYIDEDLCDKRNIKIIEIPKYSTDSVAEYLIMLMFALAKKLPLQIKNNNKQDFSDDFTQMQLKDKKVGIVGLGNIGLRIGQICSGIGMQVNYWSRTQKQCKYNYLSLEELFSSCEIIFVTLSTNNQTKSIINKDLLDLMSKNTIIITGAGTNLFDHNYVLKLCEQNKIYGYGLENPNVKLQDCKGNVMTTSEYGWFTKESQNKRLEIWFNNILKEISNNG